MSLDALPYARTEKPVIPTVSTSFTVPRDVFDTKEWRRIMSILLLKELTGGEVPITPEGQDAVIEFACRVEKFLEVGARSRV